MTHEQRRWIERQSWFSHMIGPCTVVTKCGCRFETYEHLIAWLQER